MGLRVKAQKTLKYKNGELDITTDDELFGSDGATARLFQCDIIEKLS